MFTTNTREDMTPIEQTEIRGLSIRALGWLIGSTITIVVFIMSSYFLLRSEINATNSRVDQSERDKKNENEIFKLQLQILKADIDRLEISQENLRNQVNGNTQKLNTK